MFQYPERSRRLVKFAEDPWAADFTQIIGICASGSGISWSIIERAVYIYYS